MARLSATELTETGKDRFKQIAYDYGFRSATGRPNCSALINAIGRGEYSIVVGNTTKAHLSLSPVCRVRLEAWCERHGVTEQQGLDILLSIALAISAEYEKITI